MGWLNPDGEFGDAERARKRGITMGKQEFDGMSRIGGLVTPELRAAIEAMLAKLAAPGMCNPEDATPVVDAAPDEDAVRRHHRSEAQRNHDGFLAGLRGLFASGELGQHSYFPSLRVCEFSQKESRSSEKTGPLSGDHFTFCLVAVHPASVRNSSPANTKGGMNHRRTLDSAPSVALLRANALSWPPAPRARV